MKQDFETMLQAFDDLKEFAFVFLSVMLIGGSIWLTLALRAL